MYCSTSWFSCTRGMSSSCTVPPPGSLVQEGGLARYTVPPPGSLVQEGGLAHVLFHLLVLLYKREV